MAAKTKCDVEIKLLSGDTLGCCLDAHDDSTDHCMEGVTYYGAEPFDDVADRMRAARLVKVTWRVLDRTLGDVLDEVAAKRDAEAPST